ncbi:MAG TPA: PRC-barrel domain-containing protein [Dongiaceae bacterium]|jgi:sporulation protein YlmC with PRC-barrel domain|nr:PRC-barrel domain-containing protein [Dongiaceae bacterium]
MKRALLLSGALTAMLGAAPFVAVADESMPVNTGAVQMADTTAAGEVDAGKLIGKEVYDPNGEKVGEIDSVMVSPKGKVTAVVIDVSGWLQTEKLVSVKWSDLQTAEDGKITSSLTKDTAKAAAAYSYKEPTLRRQVLTESGDRYAATTTAATDNSLVNADGSLNASKLIGLDVQSPEDKKVGDIGEVVLDKDGKAQGVVVDVGGFLGIATHPVLLDWKDVTLAEQDGKTKAVVNLTKDRLEQMPAYETSKK